MATQRTVRSALEYWQLNDPNWHVQYQNTCILLDGCNAVGALAVTLSEVPSATLGVNVAAGTFVAATSGAVTYAGATNQLLTTSATNYLYLSDAGVLVVNTTGFPAATWQVRLAVIVTGATTVTSITDARLPIWSAGLGQQAGAAQAAVTVTGTTATDINNLTTLVNALRAALIASGVIKGSA